MDNASTAGKLGRLLHNIWRSTRMSGASVDRPLVVRLKEIRGLRTHGRGILNLDTSWLDFGEESTN